MMMLKGSVETFCKETVDRSEVSTQLGDSNEASVKGCNSPSKAEVVNRSSSTVLSPGLHQKVLQKKPKVSVKQIQLTLEPN